MQYYYNVTADGGLLLELAGDWRRVSHQEALQEGNRLLKDGNYHSLSFDTSQLTATDSNLLNFLLKMRESASEMNLTLNEDGLSDGLKKLLHLATAVPPRKGAARTEKDIPFVNSIGEETIKLYGEAKDIITFIGESVIVLVSFFRGKAKMRKSDLLLVIQECGPNALGIVTLISVLVGLILAFIGAVQLAQFGAQIYVANLVGIAMTREMGAIMAGIILAGRTGAAFAAELGTMQVNEEIDALKTFGISPMEFLVLPRMLALMLMMPLLCLYADLMGILGGAMVAISMLDVTPELYWNQTIISIRLSDFMLGIVKSIVFGVLVAVAGCMRGMQSGRSSAAVGLAATSAVVTAIVLIVVTDAIFAVVANVLGL